MNKIYLLFITVLATVFAEVEKEDYVLVLTDDNFDEELAKHNNILIEFYAPWCGHCKKLAPKYAAAAKELSELETPLYIAKVDATVHKKIATRFEIKGYPKLFFFKNGVKNEYPGKRETSAIVQYMLKQTLPPSMEVKCGKIEKMISVAKNSMIFFGDIESEVYTKAHLPYATIHPKIKAYHTSDAECATQYNVQAPGIALFRKGNTEAPQLLYTGESSQEALDAWAAPLMIPKYFEMSEDETDLVFKKDQLTLIMFRGDVDAHDEFMKTFEKSADLNQGKALFSYSGATEASQAKIAKMLGADENKLPMLIAHMQTNDSRDRYFFPGSVKDITTEQVTQFVDDVKAGKIDKYFKSEDIPATNDEPVKIIVAKEFDKIVKDESKDVLVMFYAPWCGHCKKLKPVFDDLAKDMLQHTDLVISKFDATTNEVDGLQIKGYPTLMFYPKDNKKGVKYEGGRDVEAFKKYLTENASSAKAVKHDEL